MKITTIIPIQNPNYNILIKNISLLERQTVPVNIVLLNSGKKFYHPHCKIIDIAPSSFNHATTRNMALKFSSDYYLFMTQDAHPADEYLVEELLKPFADKDVVISYARQIPFTCSPLYEIFARQKNYPPISLVKSKNDLPKLGIYTFFCSNTCALYQGNYFRKVSGFTPNLNRNEDMEFAARAILNGKKIAYQATAKVFHSHNDSVVQLFKKYVEIGKFFKQNKWILEAGKKRSIYKHGSFYLKDELKFYFSKNKTKILEPFFIAIVKYIAFEIGSIIGGKKRLK